jgi:hypothetical protein
MRRSMRGARAKRGASARAVMPPTRPRSLVRAVTPDLLVPDSSGGQQALDAPHAQLAGGGQRRDGGTGAVRDDVGPCAPVEAVLAAPRPLLPERVCDFLVVRPLNADGRGHPHLESQARDHAA